MRPTTAHIRLDAIVNNYRLACRYAPASRSMAVIKANAYGHGLVEVARALAPEAPALAVAFFDEAVQLRDAGIKEPVLVLQGPTSAADITEAVARDFWLLLHHQQQVDWVRTSNCSAPVKVWLKLETGMHRLGFTPGALDQVCTDLLSSSNVQKGMVLCTQPACADDLASPMTQQQLDIMQHCARKYHLGISIANSAAIMNWPETHAEWNRPGYMLYGNSPMGTFGDGPSELQPAMTMQSEIITIKKLVAGEGAGYGLDWVAVEDTVTGTVAIGYGDGYPRHAPSGTPVLVNGERASLVGRVSMDLISVDLTRLENVAVGDPVELWGQGLSVNEVAAVSGTIGYELLAGLTGRVPLVFT